MLVLLKNHLKIVFSNVFLGLLFKEKIFYFRTYNNRKLNSRRRKHNQSKKSFWTKKKLNYSAIKDIRNLFRLEKEIKAIKNRILRDIKKKF